MPKDTNNPGNSWFTEAELPYSQSDIRISVRIKKVLYDKKSSFGHVQVFDTYFYGRMLTLDGIIQVTEKDEFIYHEIMVTLPAIRHGRPESVLIIGGGDGGAVKQALRIKSAKRIVLVEIDRTVIDVCQKFLPSIAEGSLSNDKVEVVIADGLEYVKNCKEKFDIVVLDLTDPLPDGPAAVLYEEPFYKNIKQILSDGGVMSTHCSSLVIQPEEAKTMIPRLRKVFDDVVLHNAVVPSYQLTTFGFIMASANKAVLSQAEIASRFDNISGSCKYLTPATFSASQVLPPYLADQIDL